MKAYVCGCDLGLYWRRCNFVRPKTQLVVENNDRAHSILSGLGKQLTVQV